MFCEGMQAHHISPILEALQGCGHLKAVLCPCHGRVRFAGLCRSWHFASVRVCGAHVSQYWSVPLGHAMSITECRWMLYMIMVSGSLDSLKG